MKILYLHGFASGPGSTKGVAFDRHLTARGHVVERLNLRVPSFEHLRLSAMIDTTRAAIGADERVVLIGSSLGGLTAARTAEHDDRVAALVLLAPALNLATRWRDMLGPELTVWRQRGWREFLDYTTQQPARVDYGFYEDATATDVGYPSITVPTLILHGTKDEVVPIGRSRDIARDNPHIRLVELEDGHELVASLPTLLAETDRFLDGVR